MDPSAIIAATAANLGVSDVLRWPADDQVTEFGAVELHAIGVTYGGGHAVQRLADQYARVRADKRRQLRGDALREDWTTWRSEAHTSELQSLMRISYAVFCLKKKHNQKHQTTYTL